MTMLIETRIPTTIMIFSLRVRLRGFELRAIGRTPDRGRPSGGRGGRGGCGALGAELPQYT